MSDSKLYQTVNQTIKSNSLIKKGDKVLVCVSGGPDSVVLLHLLNALRDEYKISLVVAHLDHMIRGRQSSDDARFVRQMAHRLRLPCIARKVDVHQAALLGKQSLEETARDIRYDFYRWAAEKSGSTKIATGHTTDDQAETVLMRIIKGTGSLGLSGIPYKRRLGKFSVIRPLLDIKRVDIERYLRTHSIPFRMDCTNTKTRYLRNKIRCLLIPNLEREYNPKIKENLTSIARCMRDEFGYLDNTARRICKRLAIKKRSRVEIGIRHLRSQHIALQRLIIRRIIQELKGNLKGVSYRHWEEVSELLRNRPKKAVDLPERLRVEKTKDRLVFIRLAKKQPLSRQPLIKKAVPLRIPGRTHIRSLGVRFETVIVKGVSSFKKDYKKNVQYINIESNRLPLAVRNWRKGDRMRPLGMKATKKLHDIFVDEKVPKHIRCQIPLIVSDKRILWVVGVKVAEECRVNKNTKRILKIIAERG